MSLYFETCAPGEFPPDTVVVSIWRSLGRVVGDVVCTHCPAANDYLVPDFPRPVPVALERAEELRTQCGLARVVIALAEPGLWKPEWGMLREPEAAL